MFGDVANGFHVDPFLNHGRRNSHLQLLRICLLEEPSLSYLLPGCGIVGMKATHPKLRQFLFFFFVKGLLKENGEHAELHHPFLGGGNSSIFFIFTPIGPGKWSNLTSRFFKWVGEKPPPSFLNHSFFAGSSFQWGGWRGFPWCFFCWRMNF